MKKLVAIYAGLMGFMLMGANAFATSDLDGVTTAANGAKTEIVSWVTTVGLPILFGLLVLGIGIKLGVKYVRRGARAA